MPRKGLQKSKDRRWRFVFCPFREGEEGGRSWHFPPPPEMYVPMRRNASVAPPPPNLSQKPPGGSHAESKKPGSNLEAIGEPARPPRPRSGGQGLRSEVNTTQTVRATRQPPAAGVPRTFND